MEDRNAVKLTDILRAEQGRGDPFAAAVRATRMPMIITDPRQDDHPIVFANDAFLELTGYGREEVLGRNCRFLQGPDSDPHQIDMVRKAIAARTDVAVEILNYRKDGTTFWNALYLSPVFTEAGDLQFFFASQLDVTGRKERELQALQSKEFFENAVRERTAELEAALAQKTMLLHEVDHRVKNNLQMVGAMIRNQSRHVDDAGTKDALRTTMIRVETLGTVHRRLYEAKDISMFALEGFIREIGPDLLNAAARPGIELDLDLQEVIVSSQVASPLALLVNELLTNSLKHAFPGDGRKGTIRIATTLDGEEATMTIEDDGVGRDATASTRRTFGHKLVESLVRQMRGDLTWSDADPGTRAVVRFPAMVARSFA